MMRSTFKLLASLILVLFVVIPQSQSALNAFDRQEFTFENALADKNPGFESGVTQWTASGGTFASNSGTQIVPNSKQFATWDSNSTGQTLQTAAVTVPKTGNCEFSIWIAVPSGTATHTITVTDGSNDLVTAYTITNNTNALKHIVNFPCPGSGTVRGKLTSVNANEPSISLDNGRLGSATNVGTVQQAVYKGSISMTGCTDWSRSNVAFGDFTATAGCTYTVTGDVLAPSTFIPGFRLQNVAPGRYFIIGRGYFGKSITTTNADISFRFSDGTSTFAEQIAISAASASGQAVGVGEISGSIGYTTTQSTLTFQVQGQTSSTASSTAAVISDDGGSNATSEIGGLQFEVFYFPTSQQSVVAPNVQGLNWSGTHGQDCAWSTTSTSLAAIGTGDASCTFTQLSNRNFGTVASATASSNNIPGIVFTPAVSGRYFICVNAHAYNASAVGNYAGLALHDGTSTISFASRRNGAASSGTNDEIPFTLCGIATMSSGASRTIQLYANASAGTTTLGSGSAGVAAVTWSIFNVDQPVQAMIANSVIARDAVNGQVTTVNTVVSKTTTYTATANDETILMSASGGAWTLSLPAAASVRGKKYHLAINAASANAVTIDPNSTETVCGQTTVAMLGNGDAMTIQSDGTNWIGIDTACTRRESARVVCSGSSSITSQSTQWLSAIGNVATGKCNLTIQTGICSTAPRINAYQAATGGNNWVVWSATATTTTAADITGFTAAGSSLGSFTADLVLNCPR